MKFAWLCSHESYQPEDLVKQAVAAEQAGFDVVLGSDHFHPWVDDTSAAGFVWSWLGAVAAQTTNVQLGTSVTCPLFHYHPGARRADGRDDRPAVRRPAAARRRHRRGAERAPAGLPVPRVRGTPGAHAGSAGDHAPAARRREGDLPRRVLHDRDREALLAAAGRRPDPDGRGRPQVSAVRGHLRGRPDHERQGPRGHGGQGHRAVPARRQRSGQAAPGARHPVDRPRGRPVRGVGGAVVHARPARPRPPRGDRPRRAADQGGRDGPRRGARQLRRRPRRGRPRRGLPPAGHGRRRGHRLHPGDVPRPDGARSR